MTPAKDYLSWISGAKPCVRSYAAWCQKQTLRYVAEEVERISKAQALFDAYSFAMSEQLRLHPLTRTEIQDRRRDLARVKAFTKGAEYLSAPSIAVAFDMRYGKNAR